MFFRSPFLTTLFLSITLISTTFELQAQQVPYFTFLSENRSMVNPAAISPYFIYSKRCYNLNIDASHQGGFNASERNVTRLNAEYIFPNTRSNFKLLLGGNFLQDEFGKVKYSNGNVRFGAVFSKNPASIAISGALQVGYEGYRFNWSEVTLLEANDPVPHMDQSFSYPTVGVGFFFHKTFENSNWFGGVAVPRINAPNENNGDVYSIEGATAFLGVNHALKEKLLMEPSVLVFQFGEELYWSGNIRAYILEGKNNSMSIGGIGYANNNTLQFDIEQVVSNFRIGVAYVLHTAFPSNAAPDTDTFRLKMGWMWNTSR